VRWSRLWKHTSSSALYACGSGGPYQIPPTLHAAPLLTGGRGPGPPASSIKNKHSATEASSSCLPITYLLSTSPMIDSSTSSFLWRSRMLRCRMIYNPLVLVACRAAVALLFLCQIWDKPARTFLRTSYQQRFWFCVS